MGNAGRRGSETVEKIRILIVDDHEVVRLGLAYLLSQYPQFLVVGEAATAKEAIEMMAKVAPDVVIMDVRLPGEDGIEACRRIVEQNPEVKVLMLTSYGDEELVIEAIMAGAKGYILKEVGNNELLRALEVVAKGQSVLDPVITRELLERMRHRSQGLLDELESLTKQEKRILALIAEGKTNREIAKAVYLSEKTVRNYVSNILSKLNLNNRAEAAVYGARYKRLLGQ